MADKKMLFIYNPKSGKAQIKNHLSDILNVFARGGYEVTVYPTQQRGDAGTIMINRKPDYDLVVCSGGDGTLDEVVTGMMKSPFRTPIGYIPAGSTNDFGGSLHLPKQMVRAAEIIVNGRTFPCDVGIFNDDIFVYIAAFGLFTDVSYETKQDMKNLLGHMAYLLEGVKRLSSIRSYHMKVTHDNGVIEDDFMYGMITNSESVGGFKRITGKNVQLDDGVFEVTLIKKPKNAIELNEIYTCLMKNEINSKAIYCFKTSKITIEPTEPIAWTLDGEYGGTHEQVDIENCCKAMEIRVAKESSV